MSWLLHHWHQVIVTLLVVSTIYGVLRELFDDGHSSGTDEESWHD